MERGETLTAEEIGVGLGTVDEGALVAARAAGPVARLAGRLGACDGNGSA